MKRSDCPFLGYGVGLRREHYSHVLEKHPSVDWFGVISENFMVRGGRPLQVLQKVRDQYPIVLHGVSMSLGSTDPLNQEYGQPAELLQRTSASAAVHQRHITLAQSLRFSDY